MKQVTLYFSLLFTFLILICNGQTKPVFKDGEAQIVEAFSDETSGFVMIFGWKPILIRMVTIV